MTSEKIATISEHFADVEDPRRDEGKRHSLIAIIMMTLCAVICHADTWPEIEEYARAKEEWFRQFLSLPPGIPSHDTFRRLFLL